MVNHGRTAANNGKRPPVLALFANERQAQPLRMRDMPKHLVMGDGDMPLKGDLHEDAIRPRVFSASSSVLKFATTCDSVVLAVMVER